jgi:hypothetical protein
MAKVRFQTEWIGLSTYIKVRVGYSQPLRQNPITRKQEAEINSLPRGPRETLHLLSEPLFAVEQRCHKNVIGRLHFRAAGSFLVAAARFLTSRLVRV